MHEAEVEVVADLVAGAESFEAVLPREAAFDDPPLLPESGPVGDAAAGDLRDDAALAEFAAVLVEVVAAVGVEPLGLLPRLADDAADLRQRVDQGQQLGDVVPVPAGERYLQRGAGAVDDQVMLRASMAAVDRGWANVSPPLSARTCEPSTDMSSRFSSPSRRSSASRV